jgi:phosphatidylglycerophosphate synthase
MTPPREPTPPSTHDEVIHALVCGIGYVLAVLSGHSPWLALAGVAAFVRFVIRAGIGSTAALGWPNFITIIRVGLIVAFALVPAMPTFLCGCLALVVFALDGLDGWVARRTGTATRFGAALDSEADAFFVAAMSIRAWTANVAGPWVLIAGTLRYAFVLSLWIRPARAPVPRSRLARSIFGVSVSAFIGAFVLPASATTRVFLAIACAALVVSFMRSYWHAWFGAPQRIEMAGKDC